MAFPASSRPRCELDKRIGLHTPLQRLAQSDLFHVGNAMLRKLGAQSFGYHNLLQFLKKPRRGSNALRPGGTQEPRVTLSNVQLWKHDPHIATLVPRAAMNCGPYGACWGAIHCASHGMRGAMNCTTPEARCGRNPLRTPRDISNIRVRPSLLRRRHAPGMAIVAQSRYGSGDVA